MRLTMTNASPRTFSITKTLRFLGLDSKRVRNLIHWFQSNLDALVPVRLTLAQGETFRIPVACQELQVLSGVAWISVAGKDLILSAGETVSLEANNDIAVLSALGEEPLWLEALLLDL